MKISAILIAVTGVALTIWSGYKHGVVRHALGLGANLEAMADRLETVPDQLGDWMLVDEPEPLDEEVTALLECPGYLWGTYRHRYEDAVVQALVLVGPAGPMIAHNPEVCYPSRSFKLVDGPREFRVRSSKSSSTHSLLLSDFESPKIGRSKTRVVYGWSTGEVWEAPDSARWYFAGEPFLYKVQLSSSYAEIDDSEAHEELLRDFSAELFDYINDRIGI